ncbi:MAG: hypothetical protein RQ842_04785 [Vulcanisaeta sp.]|nr:hypothetical protein [Vulcanisaeta sp.]
MGKSRETQIETGEVETRRESVDNLKTLPNLILTYTKEFMDDLMRSVEFSVKRYGKLLRPIIISGDGFILDGYATVTAARRVGIRDVDVYVVPVTCKGNEATCILLYHVLNTLRREPQQVDRVSRRRALYSLVLTYLANQAEEEYERLIEKMKGDTVPAELIRYVKGLVPLPYTTVYEDLALFIIHPTLFNGMLQVRERGVNSVLASVPEEVFSLPRSEVERLREIPREERERILREGGLTKPQPKIVREITKQIQSQQQQALTAPPVQQPPEEKSTIAGQGSSEVVGVGEEEEQPKPPSFLDGVPALSVISKFEKRAPSLVKALQARLSYKKGVELDWRVIKMIARETKDLKRATKDPSMYGIFIYNMGTMAGETDEEVDTLRRAVLEKFLRFANTVTYSLVNAAAWRGSQFDAKKAKLVLYKLFKSLEDVSNVILMRPEDVADLTRLWLAELGLLLHEEFPELARAVEEDLDVADRVYKRLRDGG